MLVWNLLRSSARVAADAPWRGVPFVTVPLDGRASSCGEPLRGAGWSFNIGYLEFTATNPDVGEFDAR